MFKIGERYQATAITDGKFHSIYDQLIANVDGSLEHLTDWWGELAQEDIDAGIDENKAYDYALEQIKNDIWIAYEGAKEISIFKGIAPSSSGFWFYNVYECISKESSDE